MSDHLFTQEHPTGRVLVEWHGGLEHNKGDRAELKRCESVADVVATPAYHLIYRRLLAAGLPDRPDNDRVPVLVALAARVKSHVPSGDHDSLPKSMSVGAEGSDRPRVSALRFRALLQLGSPDELLLGMRRVLPLIDNAVDLRQLAHDIYYWGDKVQRRWAYAYQWSPRKSD